MQGELAERNGVMVNGTFEQGLEESGALGVGDAPADDPTAEDVDDHVEIRSRSICWVPSAY